MGTTMVGGMLIRKMLEAAEMNTKTTREEKTEMKEYKCKVELSKEYTITAANPTEARKHAAELFMVEATDENPHELTPLIQIAEAGTEEDDLDGDYEEDDISYQFYYEDETDYESENFDTIDDIYCDIVDRYRLNVDEMTDLEIKMEELDSGELGCDCLEYELPFITIHIYKVEAD